MTADTVGGVWTYAVELADALGGSGVDVVLATMGRRLSPEQWASVERSAVVDVRESEFALEWMPEPWPEVDAAGRWLLDVEAEVRPDVVHLNGYAHGALAWRAPTVVVAHSDVLSWWQAVHRQPAGPAWDEYGRRVSEGLAAADAVVAPTAAVLRDLRRSYGVERGSVVPNGRTAAPFSSAAAIAKEPLVFSAGRLWDEAKNAAAVAAVAPRTGWPVAIAGEARHPRAGAAAGDDVAAAGGPTAAVEALGVLSPEEMARWLARASIFALPARYEPFGLAALEAGLCGCALVLGDLASLREVWGDAALYVDPFDDDALLATLRRLVGDPTEVAHRGRLARDRAAAYTPERMAAGYLDVYAHLPVGGRA